MRRPRFDVTAPFIVAGWYAATAGYIVIGRRLIRWLDELDRDRPAF